MKDTRVMRDFELLLFVQIITWHCLEGSWKKWTRKKTKNLREPREEQINFNH